jgi:CheY-like chemotaxis protein
MNAASPVVPDRRDEARTKRRILVVDDNVDAAQSLAMMLEIAGHATHLAFDGAEAVDVAGAVRPEVILMDIGMPRLNGYDACRRIRSEPWGGGILMVALTGWGQTDDQLRSEEAGFDHHLVKPVEPAALEALLARLS